MLLCTGYCGIGRRPETSDKSSRHRVAWRLGHAATERIGPYAASRHLMNLPQHSNGRADEQGGHLVLQDRQDNAVAQLERQDRQGHERQHS